MEGEQSVVGGFILLAIAGLMIVSLWRIFEKADKPGWASLIPFYNLYVLLQIVGKPGWWLVLFFVPFVDVVITVIVLIHLARSFGKGIGFAMGLFLFGPLFLALLAFGDAEYQGFSGMG